jgi:hypothetical protein
MTGMFRLMCSVVNELLDAADEAVAVVGMKASKGPRLPGTPSRRVQHDHHNH